MMVFRRMSPLVAAVLVIGLGGCADAVRGDRSDSGGGRPVGKAATAVTANDIERARQYAACIRANGVAEYPDPDPTTGVTALSAEAEQRLKNDPKLAAATQACAPLTAGSGAPAPQLEVRPGGG